jgi:uncharacterized protein (TIGR02594 family)
VNINAFDLAQRFIGMSEIPGTEDNPHILAMLRLDNKWPENDEVPWCSGFTNYITWLLRLPRSKSLLARSWLNVGYGIPLEMAKVGFDVVVLQRGTGEQPGPENTTASGHVGFYAGHDESTVELLAGNQGNSVTVQRFDRARILGIRRLYG